MPSPNNINKSIPSVPVDGNKRQASALMLPIVNGQGQIVNYLPVKCTDNGDGTATIDVGLALNGEIDIGNVNVLNNSNAKINPATEETVLSIKVNLDDVKTKLDTLNAKDFATETKSEAIRVLIDAIKAHFDNATAKLSAGGVVSTANTTTTPLGIGATYTGTFEDVLKYSHLVVAVKADQASATNGLKIQWSNDGVTVHDEDTYSISANQAKVFTFGPQSRYYRIVYVNNSVAQTSFFLNCVLKTFSQKPSSHRIADPILNEDDAELAKAVITGLTDSGVFKNVKVSEDGFLKVVLPPPTPPVATTAVEQVQQGAVAGTTDTFYTITNLKTLKIQQLRAGAQVSVSGAKVELYYDPNGTGLGMTLIDVIYISGNSASNSLDRDFVGNGTRRICLRRVNLSGGSTEIFGAWRGYEQ